LLCNLRLDQVIIKADIYTVDDRLLVRIFADNILIKIPKCPVIRRCRQTDLKCVEILKDLFPQVIDTSMAFVDNDKIKKFERQFLAHAGSGCVARFGRRCR